MDATHPLYVRLHRKLDDYLVLMARAQVGEIEWDAPDLMALQNTILELTAALQAQIVIDIARDPD